MAKTRKKRKREKKRNTMMMTTIDSMTKRVKTTMMTMKMQKKKMTMTMSLILMKTFQVEEGEDLLPCLCPPLCRHRRHREERDQGLVLISHRC